jgi:FkbM family methyltransferase
VRTFVKSMQMQYVINTARAARRLRPSLRFLAGQLGAGAGRYALRDTGRTVHLRHRSRDLPIFNEIFSRRGYEPPERISRVLAGMGALRVLDLGGNVGLFGVFALGRWTIKDIRSFEPEPANAALLKATIADNEAASFWQLDPRAVSNRSARARFTRGRYADGHISHDGNLEVDVADLFAQEAPDLLKIDIEGGEWPVLTDSRLATFGAQVIVLEWHDRGCPTSDPHALAHTSLESAGYELLADVPSPTRRNGLLWAMRPN